ncbi:MAG: molybdenum cofactor guanylyltransferase MobA [Candidatus Zeuxoniibacter abyssi]|nr:MAG: molybdenum cofactor guanylyltransferase MobA [Candidatus Persebacteraceae bacterium AB1(2)]
MKEKITAIILAGGRARRMAGVDKGLCSLAWPMIEWTLARIRPQVGAVLINANRNREAYAALGFPVAADDDDSRAGPLAGIHAGMKKSKTEWVLSAPCDSPFLPRTLAAELSAASDNADVVVAAADGREQPVFMLAQCSLADDLGGFLAAGGRKIDEWYSRLNYISVPFGDGAAFVNINTPEELMAAEKNLMANVL